MFKKLSKHTQRKGTNSQKVLFNIEVQTLCNLLPALMNIGDDVMLSVCFERLDNASANIDMNVHVRVNIYIYSCVYIHTSEDV